jgi:DNA replication and repair protein RecF|tara:strand:- start:4688 stop:5794 length:1107 start_codon:yes stop_codon:yes gene_type:complete
VVLKELSVVNFKNFKGIEVSLNPKINCFVGNNGQGKTTLLDAIYYLSFCKSFLNSIDTQNVNMEESFFVLQGEYEREEKIERVYCGLKKGQKKVFKRNKKEYEKLADHIGMFPLVIISPSDSNLITLGSDLRRKFLDGIISQFDHPYLETLLIYNKAITQRNALLKYFSRQRTFNQDQLDVWDDQVVKYGNVLYEKRKQLIEQLTPVFQRYYQQISGGKEQVELVYQSQLENGDFAGQLKQAYKEDSRRLFSTVGIHKDDLVFKLSGGQIKKFGSQGQQKSYLIALKLAQLEFLKSTVGINPILLLDDVFDKLDEERVSHILEMVNGNQFGQIFISDTHPKRIEEILSQLELESSVFEVNNKEVVLRS